MVKSSNSLKSKALRAMGWSFIDKVLTQIISFGVLIFLSRALSPNDFGLVGMLAIFLALAQSLINSGFSSALIQKKDRTEIDYSTVFYSNLAISVILYFCLYISAPLIASFYEANELNHLSKVLCISLIINALCIVPNTKLMVDLKFREKSIINILALVLSSAGAVTLALNDFGVWTIVYQSIIRDLAITVLSYWFTKWSPQVAFSRDSFRGLFKFSSNLLVASITATIVNNLYSLLIGKYFSSAALGFYMQGQKVSTIISGTVTSVIQGVTYPVMTSIQDERQRLIRLYKRVISVTALLTFPVMVGTACIAEPLVLLFFTEKWAPAIPVIQWLCFATMFLPISALNMNILNASGRSDLFLKVDLSKLPLNLLILFMTIPYGIVAVAFGQFIFRLIAFFINTYYPGRLFGYGAIRQLKDMFPILMATLVMALILALLNFEDPLDELLYSICLGPIFYFGILHILRATVLNEIRNIVNEIRTGKL